LAPSEADTKTGVCRLPNHVRHINQAPDERYN
jgi:hypothetical protein